MGSVNVTGHLRHLDGDRWELVANLPRRTGETRGRRTSKRIEARGVRRAEAELARWLAVLGQHECTDPERITLGEVLRRWLDANPGDAGPKTRQRYRDHVERHITPCIGELLVHEMTPADLTEFYALKARSGRLDGRGGLAPQTCRHLHAVVRAALSWAEDEERVMRNPARRVKHPPKTPRRERNVWNDAQILRAVEAAKRSQLRIPIALAAWCGLRRSEVCALAWEHVDLAAGSLTVCASVQQVGGELIFGEPKTASAHRVLPVPAPLVELLKQRRADLDAMRLAYGSGWNERGLVCCRADGEPMKPDTLSTGWAQFVRQHGLAPRLDFHGLRRSYLSALHADGAPDRLVMDRAGHTDMRTTLDHYAFSFSETDVEYLRRQEERIATARASMQEVCRRRASAVTSLADERRKRGR